MLTVTVTVVTVVNFNVTFLCVMSTYWTLVHFREQSAGSFFQRQETGVGGDFHEQEVCSLAMVC